MSWRERRRRSIFDLFDEFFRELFSELDEEYYRIMEEIEEAMRRGEVETKVYGPYIYGFEVRIGPDGKPIIREFGNVRRAGRKPVITEEREPLIDVFEEGDEITVIAEIPGVDKDKIKVEVSDDRRRLIIRASNANRKYYKEVELPAPVDPSSAKANYKNGVLEVKLKKAKESKKYEIKVE